MTEREFRGFVDRYNQRLARLAEDDPPAAEAGKAGPIDLPGQMRLQRGRDSDLAGASGSEELSPEETERLYEQRVRKVSPEYRRQAERYFRALAEADPAEASGEEPAGDPAD